MSLRLLVRECVEVWEITSTPMADEWPAGDPVPTDRETLNYLRRLR